MKKIAFAAAACIATLAGSAQAQELIANGGFENGAVGYTTGGNVLILSGQDYVNGAAGSGSATAQANHFASFGAGNVFGPGLVLQGFGTVLGKTYTLSFDYGAFNATSQQLNYTLTGVPTTVFLPTPAGTSNLDSLFTRYTVNFTGTGLPTVLSFQTISSEGDNADLLLDNISVAGVPEPATWAMMLLGFGMVGFGLRSRSNVATRVAYA